MKSQFLAILALIFISLFIETSTRRVRRYRLHLLDPSINNKYYRIFWGIASRLVGPKAKDVNKCLPASWINKNPSKLDEKNVVASLMALQNVLGKTVIMFNKNIDNACKDKTQIVNYLMKKMKFKPAAKKPPTKKKLYRMFLAISRRFRRTNPAPIAKVSKIRPFDYLAPYFKGLRHALMGFWQLPVLQQAVPIFKCFADKYSNIKGLKDTVTSLLSNLKKLKSHESGSVRVLVDTCCNWHKFRRSIHFLNASMKMSNALTRWEGFGFFCGRLGTAMGP